MRENLVKGAMAGLAGTSALNAAGYADMVRQGRAASSTPSHVVEELAKRSGRTIPGNSEARRNRLEGMGALAGIATGAAVGAAAAELHGIIRRLGPALGPVVVGAAAMAATDLTMFGLGVSNPRSWDWNSWISDAIPHLAYGAVTWALLPM